MKYSIWLRLIAHMNMRDLYIGFDISDIALYCFISDEVQLRIMIS